ncbi:MAG: class I SAM-dependent methyltransferase [Proteobacteria bacterium]|nr:class I SAM-dependent methyltransferase [Pseudomonadota bacterium]
MNFDKDYTKYWSSAVKKSIDGTKIAGLNEANHFFKEINAKKDSCILDLGCSFGRMSKVLLNYSRNIFGVDPDQYAVSEASKLEYLDVKQGTAEDIPFEESFFNIVFCWAVMDVVNHVEALKEINRVLKLDSKFLITGKNINYFSDDDLAFRAEKNAYLKNFPSRYTNLDKVIKNISKFGFKITNLFIFSRRGDMGNLKYSTFQNNLNSSLNFYEYILIGKKISNLNDLELKEDYLSSPISFTARSMANDSGFKNTDSFFKSIGLN